MIVVLHWYRGNSKKLKTFVQNRITAIHSKSDISYWSHCPGEQNPADLLTRGENLGNLFDKDLWWKVPDSGGATYI